MKLVSYVTLLYSGVVLVAVVVWAAIEAFVLGHVDPKFGPDRLGTFEFGVGLAIMLVLGSLVPVFALAAIARRFIAKGPLLFVGVSAAVTFYLFYHQAYLPIFEWLASRVPRNVLLPLATAGLMGLIGAAAGTALTLLVSASPGRPNNRWRGP